MTNTTNETKKVKKARLEARITIEQKQLVMEAASIQERSLTDFIVSTVMETARMIVEQNTIMELSKRDSELFVSKILEPPSPSLELKQAGLEYKQQLINQK